METITATELKRLFTEKLEKAGVAPEKAERSAQNFLENTLDGIVTHGVNRFPRVIEYINKGYTSEREHAHRASGIANGVQVEESVLAQIRAL